MKSKPGTYILVLRVDVDTPVQIGRWRLLDVRRGYYCYVGSAFGPGGVIARVSRHCRTEKRRHWHIDYLSEIAGVESVWYSHSGSRLEHEWASALSRLDDLEPVPGFGCSDCGCESHLFFCRRQPQLAAFARAAREIVVAGDCGRLNP